MRLGPVSRLLVGCALALSLLVVVMSVRAVLEARALRARGDALVREGDVEGAIAALRLSARWDGPFNVYAAEAFDTLERLGRAAEARGDHERALLAYRAFHAAAMASRGFSVRDPERLARVDAHIADLVGRERTSGAASGPADGRTAYLAALRPERPRPLGVFVAFCGFMAWVGGASVFLRRGVDAEGRLVHRIARQGAVLALLGWLAFALGLRFA